MYIELLGDCLYVYWGLINTNGIHSTCIIIIACVSTIWSQIKFTVVWRQFGVFVVGSRAVFFCRGVLFGRWNPFPPAGRGRREPVVLSPPTASSQGRAKHKRTHNFFLRGVAVWTKNVYVGLKNKESIYGV